MPGAAPIQQKEKTMTDNPILEALTREGVLINVSVRYWRASKKLEPGDLGLDAASLGERLISLGRKRLLPKDALAQFARIDSRADAAVFLGRMPRGHNPDRRVGPRTGLLAMTSILHP